MKVVAYIIFILLLLGLIGKVGEHDAAIKELQDTPVAVAKIDLTDKTVIQIAIMEKEIDMLKLRVEELEEANSVTNKVQ